MRLVCQKHMEHNSLRRLSMHKFQVSSGTTRSRVSSAAV